MAHDDTKNQIILAAGPIFARKGFRQTTIREICKAAKVNLASVNYYFGDKQSLYAETLVRAREMRAQQFPDVDFAPTAPPTQKLRQIVLTMLNRVTAMQSEPWQVRLLMREVLQPSEALQPLVESHFRPFFEMLISVVDEIAANESGVEKFQDWQRRQIGMSIMGQIMHYRFSSEIVAIMVPDAQFEQHFQIESLADHITQFSVGAIQSMAHSTETTHNTENK